MKNKDFIRKFPFKQPIRLVDFLPPEIKVLHNDVLKDLPSPKKEEYPYIAVQNLENRESYTFYCYTDNKWSPLCCYSSIVNISSKSGLPSAMMEHLSSSRTNELYAHQKELDQYITDKYNLYLDEIIDYNEEQQQKAVKEQTKNIVLEMLSSLELQIVHKKNSLYKLL